MDSNHDIVPTLRLNGGVYMSFAADEIERLRARVALLERRADTSLLPGAEPTHRCKVCGAYWRKWNVDGESSWNLCSRGCGECCDNAAMGDQIEALVPNAKAGGDPAEPRDDSDREYAKPIGYLPAHELGRLHSGHSANLRSAKFGPSALDGDVPVYLQSAKVGGDEREAFAKAYGAPKPEVGQPGWSEWHTCREVWCRALEYACAALSADTPASTRTTRATATSSKKDIHVIKRF